LKMKLMFLINQMQTQSSRTPPQFDFREAFSIAARYLQEYNTKNEFLILD
jgi:cytochrome c